MSHKNSLILRSSVKTLLKQAVLRRGTLLACMGGIFLLLSGIFLKPHLLNMWGLPIWAFSILLITAGLLPYRKLTRLEKKPNEIILIPNESLEYVVQGKKTLTIPLNSIEKIAYFEEGKKYGITLHLNDPQKEIFFPYFSKSATEDLLLELNENRN